MEWVSVQVMHFANHRYFVKFGLCFDRTAVELVERYQQNHQVYKIARSSKLAVAEDYCCSIVQSLTNENRKLSYPKESLMR